jgi:pimeloyl-ACP methyl ester carboxylesterase
MNGEWVRKPSRGTTVVFVHGIISTSEACWRHADGGYWPTLVAEEELLATVGVYVFTYRTDIFSGTYRLSDVVDALKEHARVDGVLDNDRIIFVCHSMGGIVVRKLLVERQYDFMSSNKVIGLFLIASPSLGSSYADWLSPLAILMGHSQASALGFVRNNEWLMDLDKAFTNLKEARTLDLHGKELIEDTFIVMRKIWRRQVVEPFSGARYFGEPYKVPGSDHFSIGVTGRDCSPPRGRFFSD